MLASLPAISPMAQHLTLTCMEAVTTLLPHG
jgi:hypothetical protein